MINSYPKVYALGHHAIIDLLKDPVLVEEKIDGSQFSFGWIDGELRCRSKGKQIYVEHPENMFTKAVETIKELELMPGWIYRSEYLQKPNHNTVVYGRVPNNHLILFDVMIGIESYLAYEQKQAEAERIGIECVPRIYEGIIEDIDYFKGLLDSISILGGSKIEGVVAKNYSLFTRDGKFAVGKYVSEKFKEVHADKWSKKNPTSKDFISNLVEKYRSEARWQKAVQHMSESGALEGSPRDIGTLIKEVPNDVLEECGDEIRDALFSHYWPNIRRGITRGLPEWYKEQLLEQAFEVDVP